jgi:hypothetical protein
VARSYERAAAGSLEGDNGSCVWQGEGSGGFQRGDWNCAVYSSFRAQRPLRRLPLLMGSHPSATGRRSDQ